MTPATITAPSFALVPFRDFEILAAQIGEEVRVPLKAFCGTIGLPWEPQRKRIARHRVLAEGASMMEVPSAGGPQDQLALRLSLLPGFLMGIEVSRLKPELQERMHLFQAECFDVLAAHFARRRAPVPIAGVGPGWAELDAARRSVAALAPAIAAETAPAARRLLHQLLVADAAKLGIDAPPLHQLGRDADSPDARVARLFAGLEVLTARGVRWNHLGRANGRAAIVLPEIARLFARHDIDVAIDDGLRAALAAGNSRFQVTVATLPSAIRFGRKTVLAHVLAPWPIPAEAIDG